MAVRVVDKKTGQTTTGKFAAIRGAEVSLYSGRMSDKKGGWRGCGKAQKFVVEAVTVVADNPADELRTS